MHRINLFLPGALLEQVRAIAIKEAMTQSQFIRSAVVHAIRDWESKHKPVVLSDEPGTEDTAG